MEANPSGATIDSAAARISGLLNPEPRPTDESKPEAQASTTEKSAADAETPTGDTEAEVQLFDVKVSGEERQVTLDELQKGYMMESDYRRKTSEVSEQRKAFEAKNAEFDEALNEAKAIINYDLNELESNSELREYDPDSYLKQMDRLKVKAEKLKSLQEKQAKEQEAKLKEIQAKEREKLTQAIPDWLDESKYNQESTKVVNQLSTLGFSDDEISGMIDHRQIAMARKAALYDELMSQDLSAKKVTKAPKVAKPASNEQVLSESQQKNQALRQSLKTSGRVDDAAALIKSLMR